MDIRQLEYFLAIVDRGGFNRAASALYVSQPSLSQAVRALERDLGSAMPARPTQPPHAGAHPTAPNAVLRILPALPSALWAPSLNAVWTAGAAVTAMYSSAPPTPASELPKAPTGSVANAGQEVFAHAAEHGDEHVVKRRIGDGFDLVQAEFLEETGCR